MPKVAQLARYCFVTVTDQKALDAIHESGSSNGSFRDRHPWLVARELLDIAIENNELIPLIFVVEPELTLKDWAIVRDIDVVSYSGQAYETRCSFQRLCPVNPIFEQLGSMVLLPSEEQVHREALEPIRKYRQHLDEVHVFPYAICETPAFAYAEAKIDPTNSDTQ